jgi:hypothetical protein
MAGLVPAIHAFFFLTALYFDKKGVDARDKRGHDRGDRGGNRISTMTEATDLTFAARRADDARLIAGVSAAHFISHFYMLVLPPLFAFVRADYGVNYTEVGLALTVFMAVSAILQTPAGSWSTATTHGSFSPAASCSARPGSWSPRW